MKAAHEPVPNASAATRSSPIAGALLSSYLKAARLQDTDGMLATLYRAEAELVLADILGQVLFPAMREVGVWWRSAPFETDSERLASEVARLWLEAVTAAAPVLSGGACVVLAPGPGDRHTLALEAFTALLRRHRQPCRMLSARSAPWMVADAVQASAADAVVIVSHLAAHRLAAVQSLRAAGSLGVAMFYAGSAFTSPAARRDVPGCYLGTDLAQACTAVLTRATAGGAIAGETGT
jgi:methylmalonyl-CoA mutase cobalamin-binding subunit